MKTDYLIKTTNIFEIDSNLRGVFKFNQFSENIEFMSVPVWDSDIEVGQNLTDMDITKLRYYFSKVHKIEPSKHIMGEACYLVSQTNKYHPVKDYIESEKWDGVKRLDEWLIRSAGCCDNRYIRDVSSKFLIAAVNRVYKPGCKFDHMIILEGEQGIGKSSLVEIIAGDWYLDTNFGQKDKDFIDAINGTLIVEISELSGFNKKDVDFLKSFLSRKTDRIRLPYDRRNQDFKRRCVLIGTYNPSGDNMYLRDDTGNRRFWPVECSGKVDLKWLRDNRKQLWAEAFSRYKENELLYLVDKESLSILSGLHTEREVESPVDRKISNWLIGKHEVTMEDIIHDCLKVHADGSDLKKQLSISITIGKIMRKLKWRKGNNENRNRYYSPDNDGLDMLRVDDMVGVAVEEVKEEKVDWEEVKWDE